MMPFWNNLHQKAQNIKVENTNGLKPKGLSMITNNRLMSPMSEGGNLSFNNICNIMFVQPIIQQRMTPTK